MTIASSDRGDRREGHFLKQRGNMETCPDKTDTCEHCEQYLHKNDGTGTGWCLKYEKTVGMAGYCDGFERKHIADGQYVPNVWDEWKRKAALKGLYTEQERKVIR